MKIEIKCLPYLRLVGETYIFIGVFKDPVRKGFLVEKDFDEKSYPQLILPIESILDNTYFVNSQGIQKNVNLIVNIMELKNTLEKDIIGDYFIWRMELPLELKLKDMNVKNAKESSKLSSQNTGENSVIFPIK